MTTTYADPIHPTRIKFPQQIWAALPTGLDSASDQAPEPEPIDLHGHQTIAVTARTINASQTHPFVTVEAEPTTTPGLAVHRQITGENYWSVTHLHSGTALLSLEITPETDARSQCHAAAARLKDVTDWTRDIATLRAEQTTRAALNSEPGSRLYFSTH